MSEFPGSPRIMKGALVGITEKNPLGRVVRFQYNPEKVSRTLRAATPSGTHAADSKTQEAYRLFGTPTESYSLIIHLDAADQLEHTDPVATTLGIHPQLASLELMMYPAVQDVNKAVNMVRGGKMEIAPLEPPLTLFMWGPQRIMPVRLTSFSVTESNFDVNLNPIQAEVSISFEVLTYNDLPNDHPAHSLYMAYLTAKEVLGAINGVSTIGSAIAGF